MADAARVVARCKDCCKGREPEPQVRPLVQEPDACIVGGENGRFRDARLAHGAADAGVELFRTARASGATESLNKGTESHCNELVLALRATETALSLLGDVKRLRRGDFVGANDNKSAAAREEGWRPQKRRRVSVIESLGCVAEARACVPCAAECSSAPRGVQTLSASAQVLAALETMLSESAPGGAARTDIADDRCALFRPYLSVTQQRALLSHGGALPRALREGDTLHVPFNASERLVFHLALRRALRAGSWNSLPSLSRAAWLPAAERAVRELPGRSSRDGVRYFLDAYCTGSEETTCSLLAGPFPPTDSHLSEAMDVLYTARAPHRIAATPSPPLMRTPTQSLGSWICARESGLLRSFDAMGTERIPVCSVWARLGAQAPIPVLPHFSAVNDLQAGPAPRTDRYLLATFGARAADTEHEAQAFVVDLLSLHKGLRDADREVGVPRALALCAPDGGVLREHVTESLFSLDGSLAVLGCYSGFVGLYDATRSFALLQHEQLASEVASLSVAAVSDGVLAIGTSQRGSVSLVSLKRAPLSTQTHSLALRANAQECAAWTSAFAIDGSGCDSSALAVGFGGSRGLCVLDSTRLAWSDLRSAAGFEVTRVACCPRSSGFAGAWIWAASQDEMLRVLDSRSGNVVALVDTDCAAFARPTRKALASAPEVLSFEFCPVGQLLCVCKNDGALAVFDSRYLGAPMSVFEHGYENGTRSEACEVVAAWSPTNGFLVSGADDYKTRVFDTRVANRDALVSCIDESLAANGAGCVSALSIALAGDVVAVGGNPGRVVLRYLRV